jgi:predicted esterase
MRRVRLRSIVRALALSAALAAGPDVRAVAAAPAPTGLQTEVVFTEYAPEAASAELLRRLLSPLAAEQAKEILARSTGHLVEQPLDLPAERFVLYVPATAPPHGYGLLVFVPPWQDARLPEGWSVVLDHYGLIYVSARRSGNEENVLARREPLALLAAYNVMQRYAVDAQRVYVGGFSGGARIALRLALGYPDVFRGALLNAGSDPLGNGVPAVPRMDLFRRFQESTRLVYLTGEYDVAHLAADADSRESMRKWCVFDVDTEVVHGTGHEVASARALSLALQQLFTHTSPNPSQLAACRSQLDKALSAQLDEADALIRRGRPADAQKLLLEIDRRFGGLAAPRSIELQMALNCDPSLPEDRMRARCEHAGGPALPQVSLLAQDRLPGQRLPRR